MIRTDAKRCFLSWRFLAIIFAIAMICIMGMSENWGLIFSGNVRDIMSSADQLNKMMTFDRFKPLMIVALAAVYSNSFAEDWNHRYFRFIFSRSGLASYVISKVIVTIIAVIIAATCGFLLFGIVMYPWMRIGGIEGVFETEGCFSEYSEILVGSAPVVYFLIQGWNFGLSASCIALIGLWLTVKKPNSFVGIGGTFFVFYFIYAISVWISPEGFNFLSVSSMIGVGLYVQSLETKLLYHTLYLFVCNLIPAVGFYLSLRKRWKCGNLQERMYDCKGTIGTMERQCSDSNGIWYGSDHAY